MMTRKDYQSIASALGRGLKPMSMEDVPTDLVYELNRAFQLDNPAFQPVRFWDAVIAAYFASYRNANEHMESAS